MTKHSKDSRQHILEVAQEIISCKGFSAVGLNEVLKAAEVPKGSFYHYFASKEAFGVAMLEDYFEQYLITMEQILTRKDYPAIDNLMLYWQYWLETQGSQEACGTRCLVVKLAAEVSDLSAAMRAVLHQGTQNIIARLADAMVRGITEGSLKLAPDTASATATTLYQLWLGASLMAKITQSSDPLYSAFETTKGMLIP
ncbi:TetR/AcrR family transcriptional regulator [Gynuella sunshinyii]|uniref:Transcriptional regulator n=1 Tax=Gynuella sunshinyii YC6258 TaxID=1445510 RepID=A0A0C5W2Q4_9GAMM|nr:TetR/AcrR family transcriptional regulator [Gynuella sunshinyii]AJQ96954.1 transcriptional regulator [Gynuella sunshinyii YC6258]